MQRRWNHKLHGLRWPALFQSASRAVSAEVLEAREFGEALIRDVQNRETDPKIAEFLARVGLEGVGWSNGVVRMRLSVWPESLPLLPAGYGLKGGAARVALESVLGRVSLPPRDIDIVRLGRGWTAEDTAVSQTYMGRDFERGMGVEVVSSLAQYLRSRDLSCNEVVLFDDELQLSPVALFDTLGAVLRPCRYRSGSTRRLPQLHGRTAAKMLRLRAEGIVCGREWLVVGVPISQELSDFDIAIHLSRALERGKEVAEEFLRHLQAVGLGGDVSTLSAAVEEFAPLLSSDSTLAEFQRQSGLRGPHEEGS